MKSLINIFSLLIIVLLLYLIITKKKTKKNEKIIDADFEDFNIDKSDDVDFNKVKNTISLHRKKITNTLYTINALNELIMDINNGILDTSYQVPWDVYKNTILITNKDGLSRIPTRILKIINL